MGHQHGKHEWEYVTLAGYPIGNQPCMADSIPDIVIYLAGVPADLEGELAILAW